MDITLHCSQLSLRSITYPPLPSTNHVHASPPNCFHRMKKTLTKYFCCHQREFSSSSSSSSSSCWKCFRYILPSKNPCEFIICLLLLELFPLEHIDDVSSSCTNKTVFFSIHRKREKSLPSSCVILIQIFFCQFQ